MVPAVFAKAFYTASLYMFAASTNHGFAQLLSFPSSASVPQAKTREELDDFGFIYEANSSRACVEAVKAFLLAHPQSEFAEFAHTAAMRSYSELSDWEGAYRMAELTLTSNASNIDALLTMARLLIDPEHESAEGVTRAKTLTQTAIAGLRGKTIPVSANGKQWIRTKASYLAQSAFVLGWAAFREGNQTDALQKLQEAIGLDPQGEYFYRFALVNARKGNLQAALSLAIQARNLGPLKISRLASLEIEKLQNQLEIKP